MRVSRIFRGWVCPGVDPGFLVWGDDKKLVHFALGLTLGALFQNNILLILDVCAPSAMVAIPMNCNSNFIMHSRWSLANWSFLMSNVEY